MSFEIYSIIIVIEFARSQFDRITFVRCALTMVPRETSMDGAEDAKQASDETDSSDSPRENDGDVAEKQATIDNTAPRRNQRALATISPDLSETQRPKRHGGWNRKRRPGAEVEIKILPAGRSPCKICDKLFEDMPPRCVFCWNHKRVVEAMKKQYMSQKKNKSI